MVSGLPCFYTVPLNAGLNHNQFLIYLFQLSPLNSNLQILRLRMTLLKTRCNYRNGAVSRTSPLKTDRPQQGIFSSPKRPDRHQGPQDLLFSVHRGSVLGNKVTRGVKLPTQILNPVLRLRVSVDTPYYHTYKHKCTSVNSKTQGQPRVMLSYISN
jgi:hypothetical protein